MELVVRGRSIKTTVEHPFYVPAQNDFVPAGQIQAGDHLISHEGELVQVDAVHSTDQVTTAYNLRVADHQTYFVGGTIWGWDVWVHNAHSYVSIPSGNGLDFNQRKAHRKIVAEAKWTNHGGKHLVAATDEQAILRRCKTISYRIGIDLQCGFLAFSKDAGRKCC
jgi:hypothetical protein